MSESVSEPSSPAADQSARASDEAAAALLGFGAALSATLPSLAAIERDRASFFGPTEESNWVLPGRLLVGAYPVDTSPGAQDELLPLRQLLDCGVTTFVCLQAEYDHSGKNPRVPPYMRDAQNLCRTHHECATSTCRVRAQPEQLRFLHLPIADCGVTGDNAVRRLAEAVCWRLLRDEVVYVHCWGGHGRTGTLVAVVLGMLLGMSKSEALRRTQAYHDCRAYRLDVPSPQTFAQRMQVLRVLDTVQGQAPLLDVHNSAPHAQRDVGAEFELPVEPRACENKCPSKTPLSPPSPRAADEAGSDRDAAQLQRCRERPQLLWSDPKRRKLFNKSESPSSSRALRPLQAPATVQCEAPAEKQQQVGEVPLSSDQSRQLRLLR